MTCAAIVITLVAETVSLWTMTGVPVNVCTYDINGLRWNERQVGISCDKEPNKVPDQLLAIAIANRCTPPKKD